MIALVDAWTTPTIFLIRNCFTNLRRHYFGKYPKTKLPIINIYNHTHAPIQIKENKGRRVKIQKLFQCRSLKVTQPHQAEVEFEVIIGVKNESEVEGKKLSWWKESFQMNTKKGVWSYILSTCPTFTFQKTSRVKRGWICVFKFSHHWSTIHSTSNSPTEQSYLKNCHGGAKVL